MSWKRFFRRAHWDAERARELEAYLQIEADENLARGLSPEDARAAARRKLGNATRIREEIYRMNTLAFFDAFQRDLRYALRALRHNPTFAVVAVLTLALGLGATTTMFTVLNSVLLRPLPYPDQDRLVELVHSPGPGGGELRSSPAIYFTYRDYSQTFESVGHWDFGSGESTVTGAGRPETVRSLELTHEVLSMLGADPIHGRTFASADDSPGSAPTVIISYGYWQRRFGGMDVLGTTLAVDGVARQVIGVLPSWFQFFEYPADVFLPLQLVRSQAQFPSFDGRGMARLKPGVTLAEANADAARMIPALYAEFGAWDNNPEFSPQLRSLKDSVVGNLDDMLWILMATIAILLLIACANVGNLILARMHTRRQELAVRAALGAGWGGIVSVVFLESVILGLAGGIAGLGAAYLILPLLLSAASVELPQIVTVSIDFRVGLFVLGISLLASLMFTLISMLNLTGVKTSNALRVGTRSMSGSRDGNRTRQILVVSQVGLALLLVVGSGLMIRTFWALRQVDPGFRDPDHVQTLQFTISSADAPEFEQVFRMQQAIRDRMATVPGVESVGFAAFNDGLPLDGDGRIGPLYFEGEMLSENDSPPAAEIQVVSPDFFETLRTPLRVGRLFDWADVHEQRLVLVISENLARSKWGSAEAALGKRASGGPDGPWREIVGVIADVPHLGLDAPAPAVIAYPLRAAWMASNPSQRTASFVVRSERVGAPGFLENLQNAAWSVNGNLSPGSVRTLGEMYQRSIARTSITLLLLLVTGGMALILGAVGIYGIVNYAVSQRRREIGIRLALGARLSVLRWMFVRQMLVLATIGIVIGLGAAVALTRLMSSLLFGVSPLDPATYAAAVLVLVVAALLASYLPARRASAVNPVETLKAD